MKRIPTIALIGLPNSGKSTLLNRICGTKKAITAKEEHTTRDLNWSETEWDNLYMQFVDTGGLVPDPEDIIQKEIQVRSFGAIAKADILVWVIDRRQNPENISQKVLSKIWKAGKPFMIVINKVDDPNLEKSIADYARLGGFAFVNVSSTNSYGINDLLDAVVEKCLAMGFEKSPEAPVKIIDHRRKKRSKTGIVKMLNDGSYYVTRENSEDGPGLYEVVMDEEVVDPDNLSYEDKANDKPKILLLGRPNVGKSSLFNAMVGTEIQIVTDIPGTTLSVNDTMISRRVKILKEPEIEDVEELDLDSLDSEELLDDLEDISEEEGLTNNSQAPDEIKAVSIKTKLPPSLKPEYRWITKEYVLLDSAGIRKPGQRTTGAESFATFRTVDSAYQADVICLVVDASLPVSHQDQVVAGIARESKKGMVVIANKADLIDDEQKQKFIRDFLHKFVFLKLDDFVWVSAKEKTNLNLIWDKIDESLANREKKIDKEEVRKLFNYLMKKKPPNKVANKKRAVIYDLIYTKSKPPTFELLIKDKTTVHWSYVRFLENVVRKQFKFQGTNVSVKITEVDRKNVIK